MKIIVDYSDDIDHLITFETNLKDLSSKVGYRNYTLDIMAHHEISSLNLDVKATVGTPPSIYKIDSHAFYKRSIFSEKKALFLTLINLRNKSIDYHVCTNFIRNFSILFFIFNYLIFFFLYHI